MKDLAHISIPALIAWTKEGEGRSFRIQYEQDYIGGYTLRVWVYSHHHGAGMFLETPTEFPDETTLRAKRIKDIKSKLVDLTEEEMRCLTHEI